MNKTIGIAGAGAFGTSIAISYSRFCDVTLFSCVKEHVEKMKETRKNEYLDEFVIPENIDIDLLENIREHKLSYVFWTFPSDVSTEILNNIRDLISIESKIIICSKGFSNEGKFLSDEFLNILKGQNEIFVLSGPNFAVDIASLKFSAANISSRNIDSASRISDDLCLENFKIYPNDDVVGVQVAGAVKNVIAIASGIIREIDGGQNAVSALIAYGLAEMSALGRVLGAKEKTFYGLSGVGDLILTASSQTSRNVSLGKELATSSLSSDESMKKFKSVCEGFYAAKQVMNICKENKLRLPICESTYKVLYENFPVASILDSMRNA
jgi:glycerol-3-phosphate dehydrogenase (NAD(P)+)